eukprot:scaffold73539_cov53-Phaeocystis_antarctica.AAC.2
MRGGYSTHLSSARSDVVGRGIHVARRGALFGRGFAAQQPADPLCLGMPRQEAGLRHLEGRHLVKRHRRAARRAARQVGEVGRDDAEGQLATAVQRIADPPRTLR